MQIVSDGRGTRERSVLALGMFDGVHLAHKVLLKRARRLADEKQLPLAAVSFASNPLAVIAPERCPMPLTTLGERAALLDGLGVDMLYLLPFDKTAMSMPPECYVGELVRRFHPTDVVCGYNHTYGRGGAGTPAFLTALGGALGFETSVVPRITLGGRDVSSSAIRGLIAKGELKAASELLGRPYRISVLLERGAGMQASAEAIDEGKLLPPDGRYRAIFERDAVSGAAEDFSDSGIETFSSRFPVTVTLTSSRRELPDGGASAHGINDVDAHSHHSAKKARHIQHERGELLLLKRIW